MNRIAKGFTHDEVRGDRRLAGGADNDPAPAA